ncbi:RteC domain-containing protein [Algibacter miyuki]|uniref:RteC domain-containing protein n=1 Tax=Algibacter miyuki TaxID=1306933 RepID=A0ABV5H2E0_9FLAO|nr:RteC domain-containing protein [Algibacter miyuki]MDN3664459.1 RteC domain-containing protein [Algibacter miyuki]MDN3665323.1 RteC domain-containing protein [Algibacter miyuki]MDN3665326.1 RteC domain-containing protein [Algibacter miyuki]
MDYLKLYFSANEFKNSFNSDFENFKTVYEDASLQRFVKENISFYKACFENTEYIELKDGNFFIKTEFLGCNIMTEVLDMIKTPQKEINEVKRKQVNFAFESILTFLNEKLNINEQKTGSIQWHGNKTELIELTKALIENGNLKGKQEDIFKRVQEVFGTELKHIDQAITKFTYRTGSKTIFLDTLKGSFNNYIDNKAK